MAAISTLFTPTLFFFPLFLLSAVTSSSQTRSFLLSCLYSVFPQCLRSLARSFERFFYVSVDGSTLSVWIPPITYLTSQTQTRLLHSLSLQTPPYLRPFIHPFKSCTKSPFWFSKSCFYFSTAEERAEAESVSTSGIMCICCSVHFKSRYYERI